MHPVTRGGAGRHDIAGVEGGRRRGRGGGGGEGGGENCSHE